MSISFREIVFFTWLFLIANILTSILGTISDHPLHIITVLILYLLVLQGGFLWVKGIVKGRGAEWEDVDEDEVVE